MTYALEIRNAQGAISISTANANAKLLQVVAGIYPIGNANNYPEFIDVFIPGVSVTDIFIGTLSYDTDIVVTVTPANGGVTARLKKLVLFGVVDQRYTIIVFRPLS